MQNKRVCFVVCPIGEEGSSTRESSDKLFNYLLKPICDKLDFECIRVDKLANTNSITSDIINYLKTADLVIADLSEHNPNAFYEIGYRKALNLPIIHIKNKTSAIPFDVADIRTFDYSFDVAESNEFMNRVEQTINSFEFVDTNSNPDKEVNSYNNIAQILTILYNIQDDIKQIEKSINYNNSETISLLADKLSSANKVDQETALMQTLISEVIRNPDSIKKLAENSSD